METKEKIVVIPRNESVHPRSKTTSSVTSTTVSNFISVVNAGTKLYDQLELKSLVKKLDLKGLADKYLVDVNGNSKRGNHQITFGSCGSKNLQPTEKFSTQFFGCAYPHISNDDGSGFVRSILEIGTDYTIDSGIAILGREMFL